MRKLVLLLVLAVCLTSMGAGKVGVIAMPPVVSPDEMPQSHLWTSVTREFVLQDDGEVIQPESACSPASEAACLEMCRSMPQRFCLLAEVTCDRDEASRVTHCGCKWVPAWLLV